MMELIVILAALAPLGVMYGLWLLKWSDMPKPTMEQGEILRSYMGKRGRLKYKRYSPVDHRVTNWLAIGEGGELYYVPLDGTGWRRECNQ